MTNQEIEIKALAREVWQRKRSVMLTVFIFMVLGVSVALSIKNKFTATSIFIPQSQEAGGLPSGIGGLASLAGINLGSAGGGGGIPAIVYPKILNSVSFQLALLDAKISVNGLDEKVTYREYYDLHHKRSVMSYLAEYTIGLPGLIIKSVKGEKEEMTQDSFDGEFIKVSQADLVHIKRLSSQIGITINQEEGFVNLSFTMPDPLASAEMARYVEEKLQARLIDYKVENSRVQLDYVLNEFNEKAVEFKTAQDNLAEFKDGNKNLMTAASQNRLLQLEAEYSLISGVYNELAKQVETAKLQVSKDTPVFTVIDPVNIPSEKSGPPRAIILVGFMFFGFVLAILRIFLAKSLIDFMRYVRKAPQP